MWERRKKGGPTPKEAPPRPRIEKFKTRARETSSTGTPSRCVNRDGGVGRLWVSERVSKSV